MLLSVCNELRACIHKSCLIYKKFKCKINKKLIHILIFIKQISVYLTILKLFERNLSRSGVIRSILSKKARDSESSAEKKKKSLHSTTVKGCKL